MIGWDEKDQLQENEQPQADKKPFSDEDILYDALRIYEDHVYGIFSKSNYLEDEKMEKAHKDCSAIALNYLTRNSQNSALKINLTDMINTVYQRFKTENETKSRTEGQAVKSFPHEATEDNNIVCKVTTANKSCLNKQNWKNKLHLIAEELLTTEESYVDTLHLIDQIFHKELLTAAAKKKVLPEAVVKKIFCHISSIFEFHSNFLLPKLKERLQQCGLNPRIGDIMIKAAPFLKMYSLYVHCFEDSSKTIEKWLKNSKEFSDIVASIQAEQETNLTLQDYMVAPVQRIPRYKMLLEQYVKCLPDDDEERPEAVSALALIADAALHSNEAMNKIEKSLKLAKKLSNLADIDFSMDVSRELLKEGEIIRIGDWNDKKNGSYLYLLNDMLLDLVPLGVLQKKSFKVRTRIDLEDGIVFEVKSAIVPNAFCVHSIRKSAEFASVTNEEKESWIYAIQSAIVDLNDKKTLFAMKPPQADSVSDVKDTKAHIFEIKDEHLGKRCPRWIKYREATMCMLCSKSFNALFRPKHHCRACAKIICGDCSDYKITLEYETETAHKVCGPCYNIINNRNKEILQEVTDCKSTICEVITTESFGPIEDLKKMLHSIARELLTTEEAYVNTLHLIDQVFYKELHTLVVENMIIPEADVSKIFFNNSSIYKFHSSILLPDLRKRLEEWDHNPRIGDIMMKVAPFLHNYTVYMRCFEDSSRTIDKWLRKSKEFSNIVASIQAKEESRNFTLQDHMLIPVQRLKRYKTLTAQYLKHLLYDDEERSEAAFALDLIAQAATYFDEKINKHIISL